MNIRPAAVAGSFYPADKDELTEMLESFFTQVAKASPPGISTRLMIVPHAGHIYSGLTAAFAYHHLHAQQFKRVVVFGPTHRVAITGLALPESDTFSTPLGLIPLDVEGMQQAAKLEQVIYSEAAHQLEHSLEVQLPFLQHQLAEFKLIPFAVGQATAEEVCQVMRLFRHEPETLIIISSDLSHFHSYADAREIDADTCTSILQGDFPIDHQQACGATIINGLLALLKHHPQHLELLDYRNSGDTAGDKSRVVGYASFALQESKA